MKRLRSITTIACFIILLFLLASCSGYNSKMRDHLTDAANYDSYSGEICDIYYLDPQNKKISVLPSDGFSQYDVVIEVTFEDHDTVKNFLGAEAKPEWTLDDFKFQFLITKENNEILIENGFYDEIAMNTPIDITTSSLIYMDSNFFFIAAIVYNGTEFLRFEDGIENINEFVNSH